MPKTSKPFTMVRRSLWGSNKFSALPDDRARILFLYVLTCPHQTGSGCFVWRDGYALADLNALKGETWTPGMLVHYLQVLEDTDLVILDRGTSEILIVGWWKDSAPTNDKWFKGAQRQAEAIESEKLRTAASMALRDCAAGFKAKSGNQATSAVTDGELDPSVRAARMRLVGQQAG